MRTFLCLTFIISFTLSYGQDNKEQDLWGPIEIDNWKSIQHISGQLAVEQDVKEGRAVFHIDSQGGTLKPLDIVIPSLAYQIDQETGEKVLVVLIQGELVDDQQVVGVRYIDGGNGVCTLPEIEFIED